MSITVPAPDPELAVGLDSPLTVLDLDGTRVANELLDPHLTDRDVAYYLTDCRPRLLFVWPSSAAACADAARTAAVGG